MSTRCAQRFALIGPTRRAIRARERRTHAVRHPCSDSGGIDEETGT